MEARMIEFRQELGLDDFDDDGDSSDDDTPEPTARPNGQPSADEDMATAGQAWAGKVQRQMQARDKQ